jgi:hypothetical protein
MPDPVKWGAFWWKKEEEGTIYRSATGVDWTAWSPGDPGVPPENFVAKTSTKEKWASRAGSLKNKGQALASSALEATTERNLQKETPQSSARLNDDRPLLELRGSVMRTNEWRPNRVFVWPDRIEESDPGFLKTRSSSIRFEQLAQVGVKRGIVFTELTFESTGGHKIVVNGLKKDEAERARQLVEERLALVRTQQTTPLVAPSQVDVADQIKKLADLRDAGILSDEEFQAKKTQLLGL